MHDDVQAVPLHVQRLRLVSRLQDLETAGSLRGCPTSHPPSWVKGSQWAPRALPAARSAPSHSSPGFACSTLAAGCCRSHSSKEPQTGSCGGWLRSCRQRSRSPINHPSPWGGCIWSPPCWARRRPETAPAQNQGTHPTMKDWRGLQSRQVTDLLFTQALNHLGFKGPIEIQRISQNPCPRKTPICTFAELSTASQSPEGHPCTPCSDPH